MSKTILITGGTGFIGAHVVEYLLLNTDWNIIIIDRLDSTSTYERLVDSLVYITDWRKRVKIIHHNLRSQFPTFLYRKLMTEKISYVLHLAASTHVDRSISDPLEFIEDNIIGTHNLLWLCRDLEDTIEKIIYFSTDEVFGTARDDQDFKEWDRYNSGNPYAATKAGAEELTLAYCNTYKIPALITHTMNVFGERQHREKYIPLCIRKILLGEEIQIHSDATRTKAGKRHYLYAKNIAQVLVWLLFHGQIGDKYNIVGQREIDNLSLAQLIGSYLNKKPLYQLVDFHSSRPGHDLRYSLDGSKLAELGFEYKYSLETSLEQTVKWYTKNSDWLN